MVSLSHPPRSLAESRNDLVPMALASARPPRLAARAEVTALQHRILDADGLRQLRPAAWDALSANALVENPFYARPFVLAGLDTIDRHSGVRAFTVSDGAGNLLGLFPFRNSGTVPAPFGVAHGAASKYLFSGTPLVHRDHAAQVIGTWLDQVAAGRPRGVWTLPDIDMQSPLVELILDGTLSRQLPALPVTPYDRAVLTRLPGGFDAHLETVLSKNRLKDVRRTMRRLREVGTIGLEHAGEHAKLQQRLEDFLRLEHAGWKGQKGTSYISTPDGAAFARRAYGQSGFAAIDSLLLDGEPIAMKLYVRTGETAFTPKITYDEQHRKLGPGMALEYLLIEEFYRNPTFAQVDAAATAEGHSALNFFNGEKSMATLVLGRSRWQVQLLARLFELREKLKHRVRALPKRD